MKKILSSVILGTLVLAVGACGFTPLFRHLWLNSRLIEAVKQGDCNKASETLNAGADPNIAPPRDYPILTLAVLQWNTCAVSTLLQHGANINIKDAWGGTPLTEAVSQYYNLSPSGCGVGTGLSNPNSGCRSYEMIKFLISHGADLSGSRILEAGRFDRDHTHPPKARPALPPWEDEVMPLLQRSGAR